MLAHPVEIETAGAAVSAHRIGEILSAHAEWLYVRDRQACGSVRRAELDFRAAHGRLIFYCLSDEGTQIWRVHAWEWTGEKLLLEAERRQGREPALLELIPRVSASALAEEVSALRRARCAQLARLACAQSPGATIERATLSRGAGFNQPGAFARILLKNGRTALYVTGIVGEQGARHVDALLSSALIWFTRRVEQSAAPLHARLWIAVEEPCLETLRQRVSLLRDDLRRVTTLYRIDAAWQSLTEIPQYELGELFKAQRPPRIITHRAAMSETAAQIIALAPAAIDLVRSRHGETLRFHGLAFARVRRAMNQERVWFGLDPTSRRILDDSTMKEWEKLLSDLDEHRRADAPDRHHALYKRAPEAWLESILRRDVTRLDPGLRLAPLHAQFRTAQTKTDRSRPVDLLALRRDGRLAVIELKVAEDREHVLQGADYWLRVETYRRSGAIRRARLFDDAEIQDKPPLVYLAAPALHFHRAFRRLAQTLRPEIELYRFDLNEDWRTSAQVVRRERMN